VSGQAKAKAKAKAKAIIKVKAGSPFLKGQKG